MLAMFMAIGAAVQLATEQLCAPMERCRGWFPHALLIGLILTQTADAQYLRELLSAVQPWLLAPLVGTALICLPAAIIRRKHA